MSVILRTPIANQAAVPEPWYRRDRPCAGCRAEVMKRVEREGIAYIDVRHPDSCLEGRAALARAAAASPRHKSRGARPSPRGAR